MRSLIKLLLFVFPLEIFCQSVAGKIVDTAQMPVSYATIVLVNAGDSNIVKSTLTDDQGSYTLHAPGPGLYFLRAAAVGFKELTTANFWMDSVTTFYFPLLEMNSAGLSLDEVSVTAIKRTVEFKNGNVIVNIEDSPLAKGNTVYDLLFKLPGVSMDNNTINLQGKSGVILLIDGRIQQLTNQQLINVLKSMNAGLIEKIEILKNPPVKYDAGGTSGMINIKTKKTKHTGLSGSAYTSVSQGFYARSMTGVSVNYKGGALSLFSTVNYDRSLYQTGEKFNKKFRLDSGTMEFQAINVLKDFESTLNYKAGADWKLSEKNTVGIKIDGTSGSYTSAGNGSNKIAGYNRMGFDHLVSNTHTGDDWNMLNYNINAEHLLNTSGSALAVSSDYTDLSESYTGFSGNHFTGTDNKDIIAPNIYRSSNGTALRIFASKIDLSKYINKTSSFEAGIKASYINTSNAYLFERRDTTAGIFYTDKDLTNRYKYTEQTFAAYFNYLRSFEKLNLQLGVRTESTNLTGRNTGKNFEINRNYFNIFPNFSMEYTLNEKNNIQININRRIDRPQYNDLNPFKFFRDQYSYFAGNPFLLPHYSNNAELTYSYRKIITNSISFSHIDNLMLNYTMQSDTSKVTTETIKNTGFQNAYTYSFFLQKQPVSKWDISANVVVSYLDYAGDIQGIPFRTGLLFYSGYFTNSLLLPGKIKLEATAVYRGPRIYGITTIKARWMLSFALKRSFCKDKLDCTIGINDIFYSFIGRSGVNFANQDWNYTQTNDSRRLLLSLNYVFGKIKLSERDRSSNEQEKGRLNH